VLALALATAYVLAGWLGVPLIIQRMVMPAIDDALVGSFTLERSSFNPLTFAIELDGGALRAADGRRLFAFERVRCNFDPIASLATLSWRFSEFIVQRPSLDASIDESRACDLLLALAPAQPFAEPIGATTEPWLTHIPRLRIDVGAITGASVRFSDRSQSRPFDAEWDEANLDFSDLDLSPLRRNALRLTASDSNGATVVFNGALISEPPSARGEIQLSGFPLATLMPYLSAVTTAEIVGGTLVASLAFELAPTDTPPVARCTLPTVAIHDLRIMDATTTLLSAPRLTIVRTSIDLARRSATLPSLRLSGAHLHLVRDETGEPAILQLFPWAAKAAAAAVPDTAPESDGSAPVFPIERVAAAIDSIVRGLASDWDIAIESVAMHDQSIRFTDRSTRRPVEFQLAEAELGAGPARSADSFSTPFQLHGRMKETGTLAMKGVVKPLTTEVDVAVEARQLALAPFAPYFPARPISALAPIELTDGHASVQGRVSAVIGWASDEITVEWHGTAETKLLRFELDGADAPFATLDSLSTDGTLSAKLGPASALSLQWSGVTTMVGATADTPLEPQPIDARVTSAAVIAFEQLFVDGETTAAIAPGGGVRAGWTGVMQLKELATEHRRDSPTPTRAAVGSFRYAGVVEAEAPAGAAPQLRSDGGLITERVSLSFATPEMGAIDFRADELGYAGQAGAQAPLEDSDPRVVLVGVANGRAMTLAAPAIDDASLRVAEWRASSIDVDSRERRASVGELIVTGAHAELTRALIATSDAGQTHDDSAASDAGEAGDAGEASATNEGTSAAAAPLPELALASLRLEDASLLVTDSSTDPPSRLSLTEVSADIEGLSTRDADQTQLSLEGMVEQSARFELRGSLHPLAPARDSSFELSLAALPLKSYDPYATRFAGYEIDSGRLTLKILGTVRDAALDGTLDASLDRFFLGRETPSADAPDLPVKLGLDLLRDADQRIIVTIPFSGDLNDPSFRLGSVIWQAVVTLLMKATTAPFTLLGSLVGAGDRDLSSVIFEPGSATLTAAHLSDLGLLVQAMRDRPALSLRVVALPTTDADLDGLRRVVLIERLRSESRIKAGADFPAAAFEAALAKAFRDLPSADREAATAATGGTPSAEVMERALMSRIEIEPVRLAELAQARADAVMAALTRSGGVSKERVAVAVGSDPTDGPPRVIFELD